MNRMFTINGRRMRTWNPFSGCNFRCTYCWARKLAEGRLKHIYKDFSPTTWPGRCSPHFKPGEFVFVSSMGDIAFAPQIVWDTVLDRARRYPETKFLLQSKAPRIFISHTWPGFPDNVYLGTTLESNRCSNTTSAPCPCFRYEDMIDLAVPHLLVSIEPIMDFDVAPFLDWFKMIKPEIVFIGADNYRHNLPEPSWEKVQALLAALRGFVPTVVEKEGLERLRKCK